jgi:hypothetical protein
LRAAGPALDPVQRFIAARWPVKIMRLPNLDLTFADRDPLLGRAESEFSDSFRHEKTTRSS